MARAERHVRLAPAARADLETIWVYTLETWSFDQAVTYADGLQHAFGLIAATPGIGRLRRDFSPPVRIHPWRSHVVIYREGPDHVLVVRVLAARQNWQEVLRRGPAGPDRQGGSS